MKGVWLVTGEDDPPDFDGTHYESTLGYFEGTLKEVVEYRGNFETLLDLTRRRIDKENRDTKRTFH